MITRKHMTAEWLRFRREFANLATLALLALLALGAAINGLADVAQRVQAQRHAEADTLQRLAQARRELAALDPGQPPPAAGLAPTSPARLALGDGTFRAALPPAPGAALALDTARLLPQSIEVGTRSRHTQAANQNIANPALAGAGAFDLAFVVVVLLPLAAMALGWRMHAHDRELGTWRMIAVVPGASRGLFAAAVLLRLVLLCAPLWLAGAVAVFGHAGASAGALAAWSAFAALASLHALLWIGLAALLNAAGLSARTVAMGLVVLWLLAVAVVPAAIDAAVPSPPSRLATIAELRVLEGGSQSDGQALAARYLAAHPLLRPEPGAPQEGDHRIALFSTQEAFDVRAAAVVARVDAAVTQRQAHIEALGLLSPALATQLALERIAGGDLHRHRNFMAQVDRYQARWRDYFRPLVLSLRNLRVEHYHAIPRFAYVPSPAEVSPALLRAAIAVGLWLLAALVTAAAVSRRAARGP